MRTIGAPPHECRDYLDTRPTPIEEPYSSKSRHLVSTSLLALVCLLASAVTQAQELSYIFTTFDFPGGTNTALNAINDHGRMVGQYTDAGGNRHGFIRQGTKLRPLDVPGANQTFPWGINNAGAIVGFYFAGPVQVDRLSWRYTD
jgi:hypothetical protein